ncbi:MAG TPA: sigma-54 dependent transcriptional regulator [Methylomirabilota bacterium]|jgi:two-component system response regulator PilR (NtrC family)|nr:sigma-54 dependent transcriptional regulator [Methylomirabilota bacterium]
MTASILVVDDESTTQDALGVFLETEGYRVATAGSGEEALTRIEEQEFDVIVADVVMPGVGGLEVLERSRALNPGAAVILMTGHATVETAVEALRRGACDYLQKPFVLHDLALCVQRLLRRRSGRQATRSPAPAQAAVPSQELLVGASDALRIVREQIVRCAAAPSNVLITGESGTGKELVAQAIHATSSRGHGRLLPVNCGAIPDSLLESQLFGHVRGAFTSAVQANPGLFVAAHGGTLFLDEIAELPVSLQAKLLRVIEEKQVWAVGATQPRPVDVRIIATTNRDLAAEIAAGRFRADLFYRLNVVHVTLPPLRERREDIPLLVEHFIRRLNLRLHRRVRGVQPEALQALVGHGWKGNVRELEHVLEQAMILGDGELIGLGDLADDLTADSVPSCPTDLRVAVRLFERSHILDVLARVRFNKRDAARLLGISLASLYRKLNGESPDGAADEDA